MANDNCGPAGSPADPFKEPTKTEIHEFSQMEAGSYRAVAVPLRTTLTDTVFTGADTYQVPTTHNLIISSITGHLALIDLFSEDGTVDTGAFTVIPTIHELMLVKAMNCRLQISNQTRTQPLFDGGQLQLSDLLEIAGGRPLDFQYPHIVPNGETIEMTAELVQKTSADELAHIVGGDTSYGVTLVGNLVRVRPS